MDHKRKETAAARRPEKRDCTSLPFRQLTGCRPLPSSTAMVWNRTENPPQPVQAGTLNEDQKAQLQHFKEMLALADPERSAEALMPLTAFLPSALMEKLQQAIDFYDYDEALALLPPDTL